MAKLYIELNAVESSVATIKKETERLDIMLRNIQGDFSGAWESERASKVAAELQAMRENIVTIKNSTNSIADAVEQYRGNVQKADTAVDIN